MRTSQRPACAWFLKIDLVQMSACVCVHVCVCVFVCPLLRLLITSGMMWCVWTLYDWLNKFYSCYMATAVGIVDGCGLGINTCHEN